MRRLDCRERYGPRKRHFGRRTGTRRARAVLPLPTAGTCPGATLAPDAANLKLVRTATLCLVNRERRYRGEHALREDGKLRLAAQDHSHEMAAGGYFRHAGDGGSTPLSRIRRTGYMLGSHVGFAVGENIAFATLEEASPQQIVGAWMASPRHRANILDAKFSEAGVGVSPHTLSSLASGRAGAIYTLDFGRVARR